MTELSGGMVIRLAENLTLSQMTNLRPFHTTILNLEKMTESFQNEHKTVGKGQNFSFSYSVFKRFLLQIHKRRTCLGTD